MNLAQYDLVDITTKEEIRMSSRRGAQINSLWNTKSLIFFVNYKKYPLKTCRQFFRRDGPFQSEASHGLLHAASLRSLYSDRELLLGQFLD